MATANTRLACGLFRGQFQRAAGNKRDSSLGNGLNRGKIMGYSLSKLWPNEEGQDVAEYSVMLAVILVIVVSTVRLIGSNAGNVFSQVGSAIQ
jgi:Flp pilus assembly pilin Flp